MPWIIIGVGNRDRGDDGAGVAVVEALTGCATHVVDAGALDMFNLWSETDDVVVVDAMRSGARPGTVRSFDVRETPLPGETFASTHSFGPAAGIELARALGRMPTSIEVIGIEAGDLTVGVNLSPPVVQAVHEVTRRLASA
ncbi:MAG: hydrogenase maturation protease [Actinomycetia bacterium]|nr:hydrogenase maturation protease [Actinomycetes bacterium]